MYIKILDPLNFDISSKVVDLFHNLTILGHTLIPTGDISINKFQDFSINVYGRFLFYEYKFLTHISSCPALQLLTKTYRNMEVELLNSSKHILFTYSDSNIYVVQIDSNNTRITMTQCGPTSFLDNPGTIIKIIWARCGAAQGVLRFSGSIM